MSDLREAAGMVGVLLAGALLIVVLNGVLDGLELRRQKGKK